MKYQPTAWPLAGNRWCLLDILPAELIPPFPLTPLLKIFLSENNWEQAEKREDLSLQSHLFSSQREARALHLGRTLFQNPQEKCLFAFISFLALSSYRAPWHGCVATGYNLYPAEIKLTLVVFAYKRYSSRVSQLWDSIVLGCSHQLIIIL